MAGLCEGGNEPQGALKASKPIYRQSRYPGCALEGWSKLTRDAVRYDDDDDDDDDDLLGCHRETGAFGENPCVT
ncbi:hypothetical protein ANN_00259 [Periplaneta americana]|uniref:Uncharacterized protein n=1 Tax=Periplaneta americana TaxID=6978 RepID=A0ABQ8TRE3_PERAM|nr:hypothetical protein ANN_00259 [Periplaneta americana]